MERIHIDVYESMSLHARGGCDYFILFIDDYTCYGYPYPIRNKSEYFEKFKEILKWNEETTSLKYQVIMIGSWWWILMPKVSWLSMG